MDVGFCSTGVYFGVDIRSSRSSNIAHLYASAMLSDMEVFEETGFQGDRHQHCECNSPLDHGS